MKRLSLVLTFCAVVFSIFWPLIFHVKHLVPFHVLVGDPSIQGLDKASDRPDWRYFDLSPIGMFYAEKAIAAHEIHSGEAPLWNPYNALGVPLLANGQSQPFAPFFLPFMAHPTPWTFSWSLLLQVLFGGLGAAIFLRELKLRDWVVLAGAFLFALNPCLLNYLVYSSSWSYVWFPWVFWAAERVASGRMRPSWLGAVAALMAMSGHVEVAFFGAVSGFVYLACRLWQAGALRRRWTALAAVAASAIVLSAWWLFPFVEYVAHSTTPRYTRNVLYPYHLSAAFIPGSEIFWGPLLVLLAVSGLLAPYRRRIVLAMLPGAVWGLVMMFPWPLFLQKAATFDLLSGRYGRTLAWFSLSVLAALGLEALVTDGLSRKAKIAAASVSLLWWGSGRLLHVPGASEAARRHWVPMTGRIAPVLGVLTLVFALGLLLYLMSMTRRFRPWMALGLAAMAVTVVVGRHADFNVYWNRSSPELAAPVAQSRSAAGLREWFPHWGLREFLPPNLAGVFGVYDLRYSDPMTPRRYTLVPWPRTSHQDLFESWGGASTARFLGVGRVWSLAGGAGGGKSPALHSRVLPGPPGRAFWVWRHQISATPAAAVNAALKHDAWEKTVYLQRNPGGAGDLSAGVDAPVDLTALVVSSERLSWQVKAPKEGWLVIRQLFWPGWEARIDGRSVPLYAGDGLFQCIRVPAGRHHVELRYAPWSFKLGVLAVFISLLWILIWPAVRRGVHRG